MPSSLSRLVSILLLLIILSTSACFRPKTFDEGVRRAEAKLGLGDVEGSVRVYRQVERLFPKDERRPGVLLRIGDLHGVMKADPRTAAEAYGAVIDQYPLSEASMLARERRAQTLERFGDFDAAIADYSALLRYFPDHADRYRYRVLLAGAYVSQQQTRQARTEVRSLLEGSDTPKGVREQALFVYAESLFLEGRAQEAMPVYQTLLREFPSSDLAGEARLHLATCLEEMGMLGAAQALTQRARPDYPNPKVIETRLKSIDARGTKPLAELPRVGGDSPLEPKEAESSKDGTP